MINPNMLPQVSGGASTTGQMSLDEVQELQKALTAGYGSDVSQLQGGGALRIQSLEKTLLSTIQENQHFRLFNALVKGNATATVDEWTEQSGIGGFLGGSTNSETGIIPAATGQYNRRVAQVKYLMTRREVSFVTTLGNNIVAAEATEAQNGALQLLTDAEFLCFDGDDRVVPTEFAGIGAQIEDGVLSGQVDGTHLINADAGPLNKIDFINRASANIAGYGNFGTPTHIFTSQLVQADFDTKLDPAFRVPLTDVPAGGIQLGAPVVGIRTSYGDIKTMPDVFIRDEQQLVPFQLLFPSLAVANDTFKPANVVAALPANNAQSMFTAPRAGNYFYLVTGVNAQGQSTGFVTAQVAVAAGEAVTLTITPSAGGQETGYAIYRSRQNGTNAPADMRLMTRIPKTNGTTVFVDLNRKIPGSTKAYILNMSPGAMAITWRQLLPMLKFPLYPTVSATIPWAQLLFGYLRLGKRRHHVVIENIIPENSAWKPFAA